MAHAWLNLVATAGHKSAADERREVEQSLTPKELLQAQQLAAAWVKGKDSPR